MTTRNPEFDRRNEGDEPLCENCSADMSGARVFFTSGMAMAVCESCSDPSDDGSDNR